MTGHQERNHLNVRLRSRTELVPVVLGLVENSARVYGLAKTEVLQLTLAAEEIYVYLSRHVCPNAPMEILLANGIYYTRVSFLFPITELNLPCLNVPSAENLDEESGLEELGLIIAMRFADRLHIIRKKHDHVELSIVKERIYPQAHDGIIPKPPHPFNIRFDEADEETIKRFAIMTGQHLSRDIPRPAFLSYPGKVVDMVSSGEYGIIVARTDRDEIAGGVVFRHMNERVLEFFGPYIFADEQFEELGKLLVDQLITKAARTKVMAIMSFFGLPRRLRDSFEHLGSFELYREGNRSHLVHTMFRLLHEDPTAIVYTDAVLVDYLREQYGRLLLAREIRTVNTLGETHRGSSIFSTDFEKEISRVTVKPMWPGDDVEENIVRHVAALKNERILNIFFEIDLGVSWHAGMIPAILSQGFKPKFVIPFAGHSDLVVFQYDKT